MLDQTRQDYFGPLSSLHSRYAFYIAYSWLLVIGLIGIPLAVIQFVRKHLVTEYVGMVWLAAAVVIAVLIVFIRNLLQVQGGTVTPDNTMLIFAPIRYYASGFPAFALLLSIGMFALVPKQLPQAPYHPIGVAAAAIWLLVATLALAQQMVMMPSSPVVSADTLQRSADFTPYNDRTTDERPRILGYSLHNSETRGWVDLTLYLMSDLPLPYNYIVQIDMTDLAAHVNRCQFAPAEGLIHRHAGMRVKLLSHEHRFPTAS